MSLAFEKMGKGYWIGKQLMGCVQDFEHRKGLGASVERCEKNRKGPEPGRPKAFRHTCFAKAEGLLRQFSSKQQDGEREKK